MEMAMGNRSVTRQVTDIPTQQSDTLHYYEALKEWEETMEELVGDDALPDNCRLPKLSNHVKEELGRGTQGFHQNPNPKCSASTIFQKYTNLG